MIKLPKSDPWYFLSDDAIHDPILLTENQSPRQIYRIKDGEEFQKIEDLEILSPIVKNSDCKFYEDCLTYTACLDWKQFSCDSCHSYEKQDITVLDIKLKRNSIMDFVHEGPSVPDDYDYE
jgi:hypothetical protein